MDSRWIKLSAKDARSLAVAIDSLDAIVGQPFHGTKVESTLPPDVVRNLAFYAMDVKQTARDVAHLVGGFTGQEPADWLDRVGGAPPCCSPPFRRWMNVSHLSPQSAA